MRTQNTRPNTTSLFAGVVLFFLVCQGAFAIDVPPLTARVNDYAGMLSSDTIGQLENSLSAFEAAESTQIVVLTIPALKGEPIEAFSLRVVETWKVGQKDLDNGALLLIAKNDRKLRIEVGYGLEGRLTDLISGRIIQQVIVPQFRGGNFDRGVLGGVNAMMSAVKGEFKTPPKKRRQSRRDSGNNLFFMLIVFGFIIFNLGRISRFLGTVAGGIVLPILGVMALSGGFVIFLVLIPAGLIAGFLLSRVGSGMAGRRGTHFGLSLIHI